ncbi:type VII toxin-antitoxin system HepT family RNase toxin [Bradymonas sediminis]|uniref:Toxin-antitoxin antitoxin component n=1 Tax=Bradymonas sediminis TaxID=1548548 RepID=A0A2Z4FGG6_9DELT|nr:DUF86 domain-containing protein [Bradymonas sediminis]AWV88072.1 toxin-antitoxin antitoxin component [Bradymonas sediminis]TDP77195.1 uncharacterized protein YutE (UPF0331/DUF86 family) [Bradymonas sediminis]
MANDVLYNKAATIERCVGRAREEYEADPESFTDNYTRQDAAILNIQRACEAAIDMGTFLVRRERLGLPQSARDVFTLLAEGGWIPKELAEDMKRMVGFRNIAVHDYRAMQIPIVVAIIREHLDEVLAFSELLIQGEQKSD